MGATTNRALSLIFDQFDASINLVEWYKSYLNRAEEIDALLIDLATRRSLDTAEGVWLDELGEIVGIPRFFVEVDAGEIFTTKAAYTDPGDPAKGLGSLATPGVGGYLQSIKGIFTDVAIDDDAYLIWIETKIQITNVVGTHDDVYNFIVSAFGGTTSVVTTTPGVIEVELDTPLTVAQRAQLVNYAPRLAGIRVEITN